MVRSKNSKVEALRAVLSPTELLNTRIGKDTPRARLARAVYAYLEATQLPTQLNAEYRLLRGESLELVVRWQDTE